MSDFPTITIELNKKAIDGELTAYCLCGEFWGYSNGMSYRDLVQWGQFHWFNECRKREVENV